MNRGKTDRIRSRRSRRTRWLLGVAIGLLAVVGAILFFYFSSRPEILLPSWAPPTLKEARERLQGRTFDEFIDEAYRLHLLRHPQAMADLGAAEAHGVRNDRLDDYSYESVETTLAIEREIYRRLHTYRREALSADEALTYDAAEALWSDLTTHEAPAIAMYPISASDDSPHMLLYARLIAVWRLADEDDVVDYIACLHQADRQLLQLRERLLDLRAAGRLPPASALEPLVGQLTPLKITETWSESPYIPEHIVAGHNPYFVALRERLLAMKELGVEKRVAYLTEARRALEREVIPAYEKLYNAVVAALAEAPAAGVGIDQCAGGREAYEGLLRHYTESDLTPEAVHAAGRDTVERLQREIAAVLKETRTPREQALSGTASGIEWDGGAPSPDDVAAACRAEIQRAWAAVSRLVGLPPQADVEVLVGEGANGYIPAAYDGSRAALLVVSPEASRASEVAAFVHREVVPGRHVQWATARDLALPAVRASGGFPAFEEGWAFYALDVAAEAGLYDGDPVANLGRLRSQVRDAARAVVDTGVHRFGWSFDRAVDYYAAATGDEESVSQAAVKACISSPGRATAALVGGTRLRALRDMVERAAGVAFDPVAFHGLLTGRGFLPLPVIERLVEETFMDSPQG